MARFRYECPLRWSDVDSYGHVNNVQTLRLLEEARVALFFVEGKRDGIDSWDGELVVVRHEIDYRRPLYYRAEPIIIETWVTQVRASSFGLSYLVRDGAQVHAEAKSVLAAFDKKVAGARRLAIAEKEWLNKYTDQ